MRPLPHRCNIERAAWDGPVLGARSTIASNVKCLFSPRSSATSVTPFGPWEGSVNLCFLEAAAASYDIRVGDIITDISSGDEWVVTQPPKNFENPLNFGTVDHVEVEIERNMNQ